MSSKKGKVSKVAKQARSKNIAQFNEDVASGCVSSPNLKHGAWSKHIRRRYSDKRTSEGRQLAIIIKALREEIGPNLSAGQNIILSRIREKLIILAQIGKYADEQSSLIDEKGELIGCLAHSYTTFSECLRRDLEVLYSMINKKKASLSYKKALEALEALEGGKS